MVLGLMGGDLLRKRLGGEKDAGGENTGTETNVIEVHTWV